MRAARACPPHPSRRIEGRPPEAVLKLEQGAASAVWLATSRGRPARLLAKRLWPAPNRVEKCRGGAPRGERPDRKGRRDASLALASRRARKSTSGCLGRTEAHRVSRRPAPPRLPKTKGEGKRRNRVYGGVGATKQTASGVMCVGRIRRANRFLTG